LGGTDGTSINTNYWACIWMVEMRWGDNIKGEGGNETRGSKNQEKKYYSSLELDL